jgi:fatty-acid desaturase
LPQVSEAKKYDVKTTVWLVIMHAGCLLAPFTFTWPAFAVFVVLYWITGGLGVDLCFHRLLTHRSFKVPKWLEYTLTIFACISAQRSPIYWVARHRLHHAEADKDKDPHSPRHGFWWAHMGWVIRDLRVEDENEFYKKYAPDLASDAGHRWIQKTHEIWPVLTGVLLLIAGGIPFLVWGMFVRTTAVYHGTWLVNSAAHKWGYRNYDCNDDSTNNWLVAIFSFGAGWHNNHHAYQTLAHHGNHRWWELDPNYWVIQFLGLTGLATEIRVKRPGILPRSRGAAVPSEPPAEPVPASV